jgi:hypothetical protein
MSLIREAMTRGGLSPGQRSYATLVEYPMQALDAKQALWGEAYVLHHVGV